MNFRDVFEFVGYAVTWAVLYAVLRRILHQIAVALFATHNSQNKEPQALTPALTPEQIREIEQRLITEKMAVINAQTDAAFLAPPPLPISMRVATANDVAVLKAQLASIGYELVNVMQGTDGVQFSVRTPAVPGSRVVFSRQYGATNSHVAIIPDVVPDTNTR